MTQPPLNPYALEAAERWMQEKSATFGLHWKNAKPIIETYLSAALPETRCVERHSPDLVCDGCEPPTPALPEVTSVDPRELNRRGWTCGCEPGNYDTCDECQSACNELAGFLNRPEVKP